MPIAEHPFAPFIRIIGKGKTGSRSLTLNEAEQAMTLVLNGQVEEVQLGAFLMLLRVKEETAEELAGFVLACRTYIQSLHLNSSLNPPDLDWSSYAGKRRQPPWYLLSALLLAQNGFTVAMHGASGHTENRVYSEAILFKLGVPIASTLSEGQTQLEDNHFCYLPLSVLCPPLHSIIEYRPLFGLRSPVHTLTRLLNPLKAKATLQSVFHPSYSSAHQHAAILLKENNAVVFKGEGGEVEYKPHAKVEVYAVKNSTIENYVIPRLQEAPEDTVLSAELLERVWRDEIDNRYAVNAIVGTMAIALTALGTSKNFDDARQLATTMWKNRGEQPYPSIH